MFSTKYEVFVRASPTLPDSMNRRNIQYVSSESTLNAGRITFDLL